MDAVFLDSQTFSDNISFALIKQQVTRLTCYATTTTAQIIERCQGADIIITNKVILTADILAQLPNLALICISATGYNNVDIAAAEKHNIAVTNVSGYADSSVAQYVLAQMLEYYQQSHHHNTNTTQGHWQQSDTFCYHGNAIAELAGKTLGIVGYGNLGKAVARLGDAFGMKVLISERVNNKTVRQGRVSFEQLLNQADIISLHCPQTPETVNLIDKSSLAKMKATAMLINTARGALVNSADLLVALTTQQIAYAVLDVLEQEPPAADHPLIMAIQEKSTESNHLNKLHNLKITAHIAWASTEAQQRLINLLSDNINAFKSGTRVNRLDRA